MKLIVLDANMLIYSIKYKLDLESELERICDFMFEIALPSQVLDELKQLSTKGRGKDKEAATLAFAIAKKFSVKKVAAKNADEALFKLAEGNVLATMDRALRKRFKNEKRGRMISIRQKNHLIFI